MMNNRILTLVKLRYLVAGLFAGLPWLVCAQQNQAPMRPTDPALLPIAFKQTPLPQALAALAKRERVTIHYARLPEKSVTGHCAGAVLQQLIDCLFGQPVNMVIHSRANRPSEVWLLTPETSGLPDSVVIGRSEDKQSTVLQSPAIEETDQATAVDRLIAATTDPDPQQRADSLILLAANREIADNKAHELLTAALTDDSAEVRAQAVQGLARREGEAATAVLQAALLDEDDDVKLAVIDNAGDNEALLQQAMADSKTSISNYAAEKLAELTNSLKSNQ